MDTKGGMMFVTLTDNQMDGSPWDMKVQDLLCGRWTAVSVDWKIAHIDVE